MKYYISIISICAFFLILFGLEWGSVVSAETLRAPSAQVHLPKDVQQMLDDWQRGIDKLEEATPSAQAEATAATPAAEREG